MRSAPRRRRCCLQGIAKKLKVVVAANHNHHGPDTAFDVNHSWYEHMTNQVAAAVAAAVQNRRPARLQVAAGEHWFGMRDGTDPQVFDPRLNVLQAIDVQGKVIATVVQWNNHPESTLNWSPPLDAIQADCVKLGLVGANCSAKGRYFTADYPGIVREDLRARYGGEVLYLNGPLGVIIGPGGAQVWEVDAAHPLGNQMIAPAGAVGPAGDSDYTAKNFRRPGIIGEQVALAAIAAARLRPEDHGPASLVRGAAFLYLSQQLRVPRPAGRRPGDRPGEPGAPARGTVQLSADRAEDRGDLQVG